MEFFSHHFRPHSSSTQWPSAICQLTFLFRLPYLTVPSLPKYQNVGCRFSFLLVTLTTSSMAGELRRTFFRSCLSLGLVWNSQSCHIIQSFTRRRRKKRTTEKGNPTVRGTNVKWCREYLSLLTRFSLSLRNQGNDKTKCQRLFSLFWKSSWLWRIYYTIPER